MLHNLFARGRRAMEVIHEGGISEKEIADSWCLISSMPREDQLSYRDEIKAVLETLTDPSITVSGQVLAPNDVAKLERIADCLPELISIRTSLRGYQKLSLRDIDIAIETGIDATRINRLKRHLFSVELFSKKALENDAKTLRENLLKVQRRTLAHSLSALPIRVLHFCHDPGVDVNDALRESAAACFRTSLGNRLQDISYSIELPPGCNALLALLSDQVFMFAVRDGLTSDQRIAVAHELQHVAGFLIPNEAAPLRVKTESYQ